MSWKKEETAKIKEALKILGYRVKVKHGIGTGSGWIKAYIPKAIWEQEQRRVEEIIAQASDRPMNENNHISVHWYE